MIERHGVIVINKKKLLVVFCIIAILIVIYLLNNKVCFNKKLMGNKVTNGVYKYTINENNYVQDIAVQNNNLYYLVDENDKYILKAVDIYKNETKDVGTINADMCILNDYFISCIKDKTRTIYDFNLNEKYKTDDNVGIVLYQDSYLILKDNEMYLNDKKIRTMKDDIKNYEILKYYVTEDNTFIEFISNYDTYVYNVKDDSYYKSYYEDIYLYENGIYYGVNNQIIIEDLINNKTKEYNQFTNNSDFSLSYIKDNLYYFVDNNYLNIYDLDNNKFRFLDYKFNSIDKMTLKDNYLYLISQSNLEVNIIKLDEIDSKYYTFEEFREYQENSITNKVKELENKYNGVYIVYDLDEIKESDPWIKDFVIEDKYYQLEDALESIDKVLSKLGNNFLSYFKHDKYLGLRIIIVNEIITGDNAGVANVSGQTFETDTYYNVIITNECTPYERVLCHEMLHAIDDNASNRKYDIAGNWYDYNPKGFEYNIKYFNTGDNKYTTYTYEDDAYFVDAYGKTNQYEDRARIFENICYVDGENVIKKYPSLLKKAIYLRDEIIKHYPYLKDSKVFDSMK